jgi:ADP-ribosyl-[dinitrogen reductase] hydrolase
MDTSQALLTDPERKKSALFGLFVTDAVAMPVHWMYDLEFLKRDYGVITGYTKPLDTFEGSFMALKPEAGGDVVGSVILHGKEQYWGDGKNFHYHHGMQAGENTLEVQITRLAIR